MLKRIDIDIITNIAKKAGNAIMAIYKKDFEVEYKDDRSPLTEADTISNEIICEELNEFYPNIPILSEENKEVPYIIRKDWEYYWCIDPLDGTKEFIKKNNEFTINIALIHKNTPVLGVVYAPAINEIYFAKKGEGAYKNDKKLFLNINETPEEKLIVVVSKSHFSEETRAFIDNLNANTKNLISVSKGSSLKLVMIAEGLADIYPRLGPTMEWDTAAADAIVRESGKMTYQYDHTIGNLSLKPMVYNKENLLNPWFLVK